MNIELGDIYTRFNNIVRLHKNKVALDSENYSLTYEELNKLVDKTASGLILNGVDKSNVVIVAMQRSPEFIIAILAIMKVGATYLPVSDSSGSQELVHIINETGAKYLLTNDLSMCYFTDIKVINYSDMLTSKRNLPPLNFNRSSESCLYIMYTSGSTGAPKGVMVPDRAVLRLVVGTDYINIESNDAIYMTADISFDAATFEIWGALLNGAKLIIDGTYFNPTRFSKNILAKKATIVWLTSGLFHMLGVNKPEVFKSLKVLLSGGDVLNGAIIRSVLNVCPQLKVINGYGPTENTTFTCCHVMSAQNPPGDNVPIGKPVKGTVIHVLDENLQPVSGSEPGILFASGPGVALGYVANRNNSGAFFRDANISNTLIYRTGDKVRWRDGYLEYIGREDNLVKIRGYRVSLEFVTGHFYKLDYIENALVYVNKDIANNNTLLASVTVKSNIDAEKIKSDLSALLSKYMLPDRIEVKDKIKLTKNGKIDKHNLIEA